MAGMFVRAKLDALIFKGDMVLNFVYVKIAWMH